MPASTRPRLRGGRSLAPGAVLVTHLAAVALVIAAGPRPDGVALVGAVAVSWVTFTVALLVLLRVPLRRPLLAVVLAAAVLQVPGTLVEARTSSDSLRYVWDGRVQLSGTSPYAFVPRDPALAHLRDEFLFPDGQVRIGRSDVPTIYPPGAQAWFTAVAAVTPWSAGTLGLRIGSALIAVLTTLAVGLLLRRTRGDPRWAATWGWCPLVLLEAGNNAHVDVLSSGLVVVAFAAVTASRHRLAGVLWGLAVLVKLVPVLLAPVLLRSRPLLVGGAALLTVTLAYLPHVLAVGPAVIGYLPGYLDEEGYSGRKRFAVIRLLVPDDASLPVALTVAALVAALAWRHSDPQRPWSASTWLMGTALLVAAPGYHWYAMLLVACVALSRRWEWLAVAAAGYPVYLANDFGAGNRDTQAVAYGAAAVVVLLVTLLRHRGSSAHAASAAAATPTTASATAAGNSSGVK